MAETHLELDCDVRFGPDIVIEPKLKISGAPGRVTVFFGPSGCGKTTCLRLMAGLQRPDRGRISTHRETWSDAERGLHIPPQRRRVGFLFQSYALFPHLTVRGNIGYGLKCEDSSERTRHISELAEMLEVTGLLDQYPSTLSGGQSQRVALARALAVKPSWLFLDEPLSALDEPLRQRIGADLRSLVSKLGIPAVVVSHDRREIELLGDDLVVMNAGQVLEHGCVSGVMRSPRSKTAASILGFENIWKISGSNGSTVDVRGNPCAVTLETANPAPGSKFVLVRAEHIQILTDRETFPSGATVLHARLAAIQPYGALQRLLFDEPVPLEVAVTNSASYTDRFFPGQRLRLAIPAEAVILVDD